jgi:hypothetical protein
MRRHFLSIAVLSAWSMSLPALLFAQASPQAQATATIGGKTITIRYSAPSVRGRKIFGEGGVVSRDPTYPVWRAGANAATTLRTDGDVTIGTLAVPKGIYSLYVLVKNPDAWELIISKQTGQWGLSYNAGMDLGRVKMTMSKPPMPIETLKYTLTDKGSNSGELRIEWENHIATTPISVK